MTGRMEISKKITAAYKEYSNSGEVVKKNNETFAGLVKLSNKRGTSYFVISEKILAQIESLEKNRKGYIIDGDSHALRLLIKVLAECFSLELTLEAISVGGRLFGTQQYASAIDLLKKEYARRVEASNMQPQAALSDSSDSSEGKAVENKPAVAVLPNAQETSANPVREVTPPTSQQDGASTASDNDYFRRLNKFRKDLQTVNASAKNPIVNVWVAVVESAYNLAKAAGSEDGFRYYYSTISYVLGQVKEIDSPFNPHAILQVISTHLGCGGIGPKPTPSLWRSSKCSVLYRDVIKNLDTKLATLITQKKSEKLTYLSVNNLTA